MGTITGMRAHLRAVAVTATLVVMLLKKIATMPRPPNDGCQAPSRP